MPENGDVPQHGVDKNTKTYVPRFIRDFSKENDPEKRNKLSQELEKKEVGILKERIG